MSARHEEVPQASVMREQDLGDIMVVELGNYEYPWTEGIFKDCLNAGYSCQVLRLDGVLIGYGILQVGVDEAHILNLCIDRQFGRRGYARQLLERLLDLAVRQGANMVFLEVRPSNPRAIRLYSHAGFNEIGLRRDYYNAKQGREDAIVMARSVGPAPAEV